jgi:hypothetical protein
MEVTGGREGNKIPPVGRPAETSLLGRRRRGNVRAAGLFCHCANFQLDRPQPPWYGGSRLGWDSMARSANLLLHGRARSRQRLALLHSSMQSSCSIVKLGAASAGRGSDHLHTGSDGCGSSLSLVPGIEHFGARRRRYLYIIEGPGVPGIGGGRRWSRPPQGGEVQVTPLFFLVGACWCEKH